MIAGIAIVIVLFLMVMSQRKSKSLRIDNRPRYRRKWG